MRPAAEKRVLDELDRLLEDLPRIRPLLLTALARDDEPASEHVHDKVHEDVRKLYATIMAMAVGVNVAVNLGRHIGADAQGFTGREPSVLDCICCRKPAVPRPKRGLCGGCYMAYRRSEFHDLALFIPWRLEQLASEGRPGNSGTMVPRASDA